MIFRLLCLFPLAALFTLTIWPFDPPPTCSPLRWRPHKELCFHWSSGSSTGVFLSIRANVRPPFSQWIPTKLASSPISSYSAPASVSIPLQLSWDHLRPHSYLFQTCIFAEGQIISRSQGLTLYLCFLVWPL